MRHVDLVANDWVAGKQSWLARVIAIDSGGVKVEAVDSTWEKRLHQPITLATGEVFSPEDGYAYLDGLTRKYQGTHVEATSAHEDMECAFFVPDRPMVVSRSKADFTHTVLGFVERLVPGRPRRRSTQSAHTET